MIIRKIGLGALTITAAFLVVGCEKGGDSYSEGDAKKAVDKATTKASDAVEKAGDKAKEMTDDAGKAVDDLTGK